jgi:hypothetical protein
MNTETDVARLPAPHFNASALFDVQRVAQQAAPWWVRSSWVAGTRPAMTVYGGVVVAFSPLDGDDA